MTIGVGGRSIDQAEAGLADMSSGVPPIERSEFENRLSRLQMGLKTRGARAAYLHAGTNLYYFTGLRWHPSERMVAAIIPDEGDITYIAPRFELDTLRDYWMIESEIAPWEEHESPYESVREILGRQTSSSQLVLVDEVTPFFTYDGLRKANPDIDFQHAQPLTQSLRSRKSKTELAIIQRAHEMTLEVMKAAASILHEGITTNEVEAFIDDAHRRVGATDGSFFCIVLFGVPTSFLTGSRNLSGCSRAIGCLWTPAASCTVTTRTSPAATVSAIPQTSSGLPGQLKRELNWPASPPPSLVFPANAATKPPARL